MIPISITPTSGRFVKQEQWEHSVADLGLFLEGGGATLETQRELWRSGLRPTA